MPLYAFKGQRPVRHPSAWVAPSADVIGDVVLGEDVGVWFGAVIRGDNTTIPIGARSNVQEGAMLHSDPGTPLRVGEDCTIGHHAVLHGCTIGNRVLIGMGAIILNRAVIADDCIVGAGALVTEGKTFPPRSLIVGSPARAVRELDDAAVAALKVSAAHYVANARAAADGLERVE
ncbi:gamma carbonic anhydrase family protein [Sphingomonas phyllosphaerae]|uniref:gamma carbonic anhydrase family protein n=1 Tax=Sphingomonas phyllosphaerae TaxID=257003 RepID=UPI000426A4B2|nr:gamma carbonic anhydrase family protein [Sphingomonas phyllosphaerae]